MIISNEQNKRLDKAYDLLQYPYTYLYELSMKRENIDKDAKENVELCKCISDMEYALEVIRDILG